MWLIRKLTPDFRTIFNFRRDNKTAIRKVFKEFNRFCYKMNLFSLEGISIDGSKFKAVNAKDNNFTQSKLDDRPYAETEEDWEKLLPWNIVITPFQFRGEWMDLAEQG